MSFDGLSFGSMEKAGACKSVGELVELVITEDMKFAEGQLDDCAEVRESREICGYKKDGNRVARKL